MHLNTISHQFLLEYPVFSANNGAKLKILTVLYDKLSAGVENFLR